MYKFGVNKIFYMKRSFFVLLLVLFSFNVFSQYDTLQSVSIQINYPDFLNLMESGVNPVHGKYHKAGKFVGEFYIKDVREIISMGYFVQIIDQDITASFLRKNNNTTKNNPITNHNCRTHFTDYGFVYQFRLGSMGGYLTFNEIIKELDTMKYLYPQLVPGKNIIGMSVENRPVYSMVFTTNPDSIGLKPQVLFTALHHAQEPGSAHQLVYFMHYLLQNYGVKADVTYLINNLDIFFVPCVNPDGFVYNQTQNPNGGGTWRKNRRHNDLLTYGIDLNRNYGIQWGYDNIGSQAISASPYYRGTSAFSEPESSAMRDFINAHSFKIAINWHSFGNLFIYPWNYKNLQTADSATFVKFSEIITSESDYRYGTVAETYGYQSNGDADDWGYGDESSRKKIISITAEIGPMNEGFWPASNLIEPYAKKSLSMNLNTLRLMLDYAWVTEKGSRLLSPNLPKLNYRLLCVGLDTPSTFTVSVQSLDGLQILSPNLHTYSNMTLFEHVDSAFNIMPMGVVLPFGTELNFVISVDNGKFVYRDTIQKIFGDTVCLFSDDASQISQWNASGWSVTTETAYSGNSCFTESPNGNYSILNTSTLTLNNPVNLVLYSHASLNFRAKWDIEKGNDYLQVFYSIDNGTSWNPMCGKYTNIGTDDQQEGYPVYDGNQPEWIYEDINLDFLCGNNVLFKFTFKSDQSNNFNGFFIDDIKVNAIKLSGVQVLEQTANEIDVSPNPANTYVNISWKKNISAKQIVVSDNIGRIVKEISINDGDFSQNIDLKDFKSGLYFISIYTSNAILKSKFVVR